MNSRNQNRIQRALRAVYLADCQAERAGRGELRGRTLGVNFGWAVTKSLPNA